MYTKQRDLEGYQILCLLVIVLLFISWLAIYVMVGQESKKLERLQVFEEEYNPTPNELLEK